MLLVMASPVVSFAVEAEVNLMTEGVVKPFRSVTISASIREIIGKIQVEEGERIKEGQLLVSLLSEKQRLAVERYDQMISKAQFDFNAAQRLFQQNVASRDDALAKEVELKRLQAELAIAKAEVNEREIVSPLTGVVVRKFKESGESISENDPILQVMTTDQVLLLFHLEASQLSLLKLGQEYPAQFPEMPEVKGLKAKINFIDPEVDARSGLFRVRLLLDNKAGLIRPGLRVLTPFPTVSVNP
ncbi:efflux RND transporter periplasmic adaptor subunit [Phragmitibacter flavus]|nr:efflux RND transporter periplasmic adaptor subunit [Phragmitibacter flavus]